MEPYAIVETGGKQYRVQAGSTLRVESLAVEAGEKVDLGPALAVSDGTGLQIGQPTVDGSSVTCSVVEHSRAKKVVSFKQKRRKGYSRKIGHRQEQTLLKVESL